MTYKAVYIDDEDFNIANLLEVDLVDKISFVKKSPNSLSKTTEEVVAEKPDILFLDYRLDQNKVKANKENDFRAGSLAQALREKFLESPKEDFPIVIVSSEQKIKNFYKPDKTAHDLFDAYYTKEEVTKDAIRASIVQKALSLTKGYKILADLNSRKDWKKSLLSLTDKELSILDDTDFEYEIPAAVASHVLAQLLLKRLIYPSGLLLRPEDIHARLGIEVKDTKEASDQFNHLWKQGLGYTGIFHEGWPRIWRHRFEDWAKKTLGKAITSIPANERVKNLNALLIWKCSTAKSPFNKKDNELLAFACASCSRPTEIRNSVAARNSSTIKYLERQRICFDCVETDKFLEQPHLHISKDDLNLVDDLQKGKIKRDE